MDHDWIRTHVSCHKGKCLFPIRQRDHAIISILHLDMLSLFNVRKYGDFEPSFSVRRGADQARGTKRIRDPGAFFSCIGGRRKKVFCSRFSILKWTSKFKH